MKSLDSLFSSARNSRPPLNREQVAKLITSKPVTPLKGKFFSTKVVLALTVTAVVTVLTLVLWKSTAEMIPETVATVNNNPGFTYGEERTDIPVRDKNETTVEHSNISGGQTKFSGQVSNNSERNVSPEETLNVKEPAELFYYENNGRETIADDLLPVTGENAPDIMDKRDTLEKLSKDVFPLTVKDTTRKKKSEPLASVKKNFVRTDLFGYLYNAFPQQLFFRTTYIDSRAVSGNRISIAYEHLITSRFSAGIQASYGFAPYSHSAHRTDSAEERFSNFKGWMLNLDTRYYFGKKADGTGLYAGVFFAYGSIQERVFVTRGEWVRPPGTKTLIVSKGNSWGLGLNMGYKIPLKMFYVEPSIGVMVVGKDNNYYNWAYKGQQDQHRYNALNRYEINIGYRF